MLFYTSVTTGHQNFITSKPLHLPPSRPWHCRPGSIWKTKEGLGADNLWNLRVFKGLFLGGFHDVLSSLFPLFVRPPLHFIFFSFSFYFSSLVFLFGLLIVARVCVCDYVCVYTVFLVFGGLNIGLHLLHELLCGDLHSSFPDCWSFFL